MQPGIETLCGVRRDWVAGRRVALLSHAAAVGRAGAHAGDRLRAAGAKLVAVLGPEHGYFGHAGAGAAVGAARHPQWRVPVHSLYGDTRRPTRAMLRGADVVVHDLQDLGVRPYTYVSTLRLLLEAAAEFGVPVIVADRPIPLPAVCDGPLTDPALTSFVGAIPAPMVYGMTPGETALWLVHALKLDVDLRVAPLRGWRGEAPNADRGPEWIPPSPGIVTWETARLYPATVFCEAFEALDMGRNSGLSFRVLGAPHVRAPALLERLAAARLPGVTFHPHAYTPRSGPYAGVLLQGIRLCVLQPARFRPIRTAVTLVSALQALLGRRGLWQAPGSRPAFFDKLFATATVREQLLDRVPPARIAAAWQPDLRRFRTARAAHLLYPRGPAESAP